MSRDEYLRHDQSTLFNRAEAIVRSETEANAVQLLAARLIAQAVLMASHDIESEAYREAAQGKIYNDDPAVRAALAAIRLCRVLP